MNTETLDLSTLRDAIKTLGVALSEYDSDKSNPFVRDACIKRFEYCYEFTTKMITRHLSITEADPSEVKAMSFQDKIRRAYDIGIIPNSWDRWLKYRDDRNATSHGYSKQRAIELVEEIPAFQHEAESLLLSLENIYETEV